MKVKEILAVIAVYMLAGLAACFFCACRLFGIEVDE